MEISTVGFIAWEERVFLFLSHRISVVDKVFASQLVTLFILSELVCCCLFEHLEYMHAVCNKNSG